MDLVRAKLDAGAGVQDLADAFGFSDGVPGYSYFTIGLALFAFLQHRSDPASGMRALRDTGGDTDTVGAIAGSFWGCEQGRSAFPASWWNRLADWPMSRRYLDSLARAAAGKGSLPTWVWPLYPLRAAAFLAIIISHGFLRLVR